MNFDDIIELLLHKKAVLREEIEREFALRSAKIDELLTAAGYVEPVAPPEAVAEVAEIVAEIAPEQSADVPVMETVADAPVNTQVVY